MLETLQTVRPEESALIFLNWARSNSDYADMTLKSKRAKGTISNVIRKV